MNMNFKIALVILWMGISGMCLHAQTILSGRVTNQEGTPVAANVHVKEKGSTLLSGYAATDGNGNYSVSYKGKADSLTVIVSSIFIGKHEKNVRNVSQQLDFVIEEKGLKLKEVTVRADKIRQEQDTISYLVGAFSDQNDRVIGSVLKKMPGIEVSDNGKISFNGQPISKFYVEGMDLLQGKYGIAVNNIPAKAVSLVQVLENHQPIKVLRDKVPTDAVAINLKLKEEAKGVFTATGMLGAGYQPLLWNTELVGMLFGRKYQTMTVYKGNNSGDDVTSEFRSHYGNSNVSGSTLGSMLRVQAPAQPDISPKRYIENHSHAVSTNHLMKFREEQEWSTGVQYYNDRIDKEGHSLTEQYLPDGNKIVVDESVASVNHVHNLEMTSRLNINKAGRYINDALMLKAGWNRDTGTGSVFSNTAPEGSVISQRLKRPHLSLGNNLDMIKEWGKNTWQFHFAAGYNEKPQTLSISPVTYWEEMPLNSLSQDVSYRNLSSELRFSYGLKLNSFFLNYTLWGDAELQNLESELEGDGGNGNGFFSDAVWRNDLWYNTWRAGIMQNYTYQRNNLKISLMLPATYYRLSVNDQSGSGKRSYDKPQLTPSLSFGYDWRNFHLFASGNYSNRFGDLNSAFSGYIMQGYRNLLRNTSDHLLENRQTRAVAGINYKDVFTALFCSMGGGYQHGWTNLLYGYDYSGIMRIKRELECPTASDTYSANFSISKGFDFRSSTLSLSGRYAHSNSEQLIQGEVTDFVSENISLEARGNISPASWMSLDYACDWNRMQSYAPAHKNSFSVIKSVRQKLNLNFFPTSKLTLNWGIEHQYTNLATTKNMLFGDLRVKWKVKKMDIELEANNLFNQKKYMKVFYGDMNMYRYSYDLRPVNALVKIRYNFKQ